MLSSFSKIILDVSQTLYDENQIPLAGSDEFLRLNKNKILIVSNVGSLTGTDLRKRLLEIFNIEIHEVVTSLDLVINYLNKNNCNNIYHYGSEKVLEKLKRKTTSNFIESNLASEVENILFTSLYRDNGWIRATQEVLNLMVNDQVSVILGNPDRSCPGKPHNFTVSLLYDALLLSCRYLGYRPRCVELGKPNIIMSELGVMPHESAVVIGDNPDTDGMLAVNNALPYIQIGRATTMNKEVEKVLIAQVDSLHKLL